MPDKRGIVQRAVLTFHGWGCLGLIPHIPSRHQERLPTQYFSVYGRYCPPVPCQLANRFIPTFNETRKRGVWVYFRGGQNPVHLASNQLHHNCTTDVWSRFQYTGIIHCVRPEFPQIMGTPRVRFCLLQGLHSGPMHVFGKALQSGF